MNIENIKRAIEHLKTVKPEQFNMLYFRSINGDNKPECGSVGCIVGHCTVLDYDNVKENYTNFGSIDFFPWSVNFFGISRLSNEWDYMFSSNWGNLFNNDETNSIEHAIYRMQRIVDGYKPEDIIIEAYGN